MKLSSFLATRKLTAMAFADQLGVAPSTVTRWLHGTTIPERRTMELIFEVTEGKVRPNSFFELGNGA